MGRKSNADARRSQIADALISLLSRSSYAEISVAAIAKKATLAPGLVHHHFQGKDEVLELAVLRLSLVLEVRLDRRLRQADDGNLAPAECIDAFIDAWLAVDDGSGRDAALAWVAVGDEARCSQKTQVLYDAALKRAQMRLASFFEAAWGERTASGNKATQKKRAALCANAVVIAIEGALRVGAAGGIEEGKAAPLVKAMAQALLASPTPLARNHAALTSTAERPRARASTPKPPPPYRR